MYTGFQSKRPNNWGTGVEEADMQRVRKFRDRDGYVSEQLINTADLVRLILGSSFGHQKTKEARNLTNQESVPGLHGYAFKGWKHPEVKKLG